MPEFVPPQVSIKALRVARGLTLDQLADRIHEQGVEITKIGLSNAEKGHRKPSRRLVNAWARALEIDPVHVSHHEDIGKLFKDVEADNANEAEVLEQVA